MIRGYTGTQVRAAEAPLLEAGRGAQLMQRAAFGLAAAIADELRSRSIPLYGTRIVVLAGAGNNGADALYAAARLAGRGASTTAVLTAARVHPEAIAAFVKAGGRVLQLVETPQADGGMNANGDPQAGNSGEGGISGGELDAAAAVSVCRRAGVIIDGILGTGASGPLREPAASLVRGLDTLAGSRPSSRTPSVRAATQPLFVACDVPSGVDADTGETAGDVLAADLTVTFGAVKAGVLTNPGAETAGRIHSVPIGIEDRLPEPAVRRLETEDLALLWPAPAGESHKYSRGVLGIVAGSAQYPGAASLCVEAALGTGTGMVRFLGPESVARQVITRAPEVVTSQGSVAENHVQAWLVGPGIGGDDAQLQRARNAIGSGLPTVVDASALPHLPAQLGPHIILTPHAGELAGVLNHRGLQVDPAEIVARRGHYAATAARLTGATVLLKGATTVVAAPSGLLFSQAESTSWMATAGSGDVLAGILGALLSTLHTTDVFAAAGFPEPDHYAAIAALAASVHGRAGRIASGGGPMTSSEISKLITEVFIAVQNGAP